MNKTARFYLIILIYISFITACGTVKPPLSPQKINGMDTTMGTYSKQDTEKLILVTMENAIHKKLIEGTLLSDQSGPLPPAYSEFLNMFSKRYGLKRVADWPLSSLNIRCLVFEISPDNTLGLNNIVAQLNTEPYVETAQPLQLFVSLASEYNDPYLQMQHGFKVMQADIAHQWATGKGVKIAVIDTGIDIDHSDLNQRLLGNKNFVDGNTEAFKTDIHGTAIAGVIVASANNGTGMVGIAPEANILAFKSCWEEASGDGGAICNSFTLAKAINLSIAKNVDVINLSLSGPKDPILERLVNKALEKNIAVIGAVHPNKFDSFPTSVEGVIAVSEAEHHYRSTRQYIKAPGAKVLSAHPGNKYDFYSGSSLSTAHISGLVALIKQRKPHMPVGDIQTLLVSTIEPSSGLTNACRTLGKLVGINNRCARVQ